MLCPHCKQNSINYLQTVVTFGLATYKCENCGAESRLRRNFIPQFFLFFGLWGAVFVWGFLVQYHKNETLAKAGFGVILFLYFVARAQLKELVPSDSNESVTTVYFLFMGFMQMLITIAMIVFFASFMVFKLVTENQETPESFQEPRISVGKGEIKKSKLFESDQLSHIADIKYGEYFADPGPEIVIAAQNGALFLDEQSKVIKQVKYDACKASVRITDIQNDGLAEFIIGKFNHCRPLILDHRGQEIWNPTKIYDTNVSDLLADDFDNDGFFEYVVQMGTFSDELAYFDHDFKKAWSKEAPAIIGLLAIDPNKDEQLEILTSYLYLKKSVIDNRGTVVHEREREHPLDGIDFSYTTKWPTINGDLHFMEREDDEILIFSTEGDLKTSYVVPEAGSSGGVFGTPVKLSEQTEDYYAILMGYSNWDRSMIYIYNPEQKLIYQELLPEYCITLYPMPVSNTNLDRLLVGCRSQVWQFDLR